MEERERQPAHDDAGPQSVDQVRQDLTPPGSWRRNIQWLIVGGAVAAIALIVANRGDHHVGVTQVAPTSPSPDGGTYPDADAVLAALATAGIPCTAPSPVANPTREGTTSMTDCTGAGSPDSDTVIVVFDNHADAYAYAQSMTDPSWNIATGIPTQVVYGVNWAINTVPAYGAKVLAALGGDTLTATPSASANS